jgi:hypothetical protein
MRPFAEGADRSPSRGSPGGSTGKRSDRRRRPTRTIAATVQKTRVKTGADRCAGGATDSRRRDLTAGDGVRGSSERGSTVAASR